MKNSEVLTTLMDSHGWVQFPDDVQPYLRRLETRGYLERRDENGATTYRVLEVPFNPADYLIDRDLPSRHLLIDPDPSERRLQYPTRDLLFGLLVLEDSKSATWRAFEHLRKVVEARDVSDGSTAPSG
ncbi:MAG: hypothetical protein AABX14_02540 [Candidatus Aenigmatarchaeota archaeon]